MCCPNDLVYLWWYRSVILCRCAICLTLCWRRPFSYRNQSIDLLRKSMGWFLCDNGLRHERVNDILHVKWMCHVLTQGIRTIKIFIKCKKVLLSINLSQKNTRIGSSVKCWVHCDKIKTVKSKVPSINYINFQIFVVKLKLLLHFMYILLLTSHWC